MTHAERWNRRRQIARAVKAGGGTLETLTNVGGLFGATPHFVRSCCYEFGVTFESGHPGPADKTLGIVALLTTTNTPYTVLATKFGVSKQWVYQIACRCRKKGLVVRLRKRSGRPKKGSGVTTTPQTGG